MLCWEQTEGGQERKGEPVRLPVKQVRNEMAWTGLVTMEVGNCSDCGSYFESGASIFC